MKLVTQPLDVRLDLMHEAITKQVVGGQKVAGAQRRRKIGRLIQ